MKGETFFLKKGHVGYENRKFYAAIKNVNIPWNKMRLPNNLKLKTAFKVQKIWPRPIFSSF
jgi:hypothetical protein